MHSATTPTGPQASPRWAQGRPAPHEEPEFNNERDIPTESGDLGGNAASGGVDEKAVPVEESVAGEEDPGAALDELADEG